MIDYKLKSEINPFLPKAAFGQCFYHSNRKRTRTWTNLHCKGLFHRFSWTVYDKSLSNYCLACHQKAVTQSQIDEYSFSHSFCVLWQTLLKCLRGNCWQRQRTQAGEAGSYLNPVLRSYDPLSLSFIIIGFKFPLDWSGWMQSHSEVPWSGQRTLKMSLQFLALRLLCVHWSWPLHWASSPVGQLVPKAQFLRHCNSPLQSWKEF